MASWDESFDLVIVGSGGGGMVAALAAAKNGLKPLLLEKQAVLGGSTAMSGGVIWLPNNPLMQREHVPDSFEDGMAHFAAVVGDIGLPSSIARRETFLHAGSEMVRFLEADGVEFLRCPGYSDYYTNAKGGNAAGRSIEVVPFDSHELGEWGPRVQPGLARGIGFVVKTNELRMLQYFNRSPKALAVAARVFARTQVAKARRQDLLTNGASLIAQILRGVLGQAVPIWTETAVEDLVVEAGRVVGVRAIRNGTPVTVAASKGVLLAAGGFSRNPAMRRKFSGDQPNEAEWSIANAGDTGEVLEAALKLGAATDLMDEAWWLPTPFDPALAGSTLGQGRQRPGAIYVNPAGKRFVNEANSYVEVGKAMYANDAVPAWQIFDDGYRRRYMNTSKGRPGTMPDSWVDSGAVKKADTLAGLAEQTGIDAEGLVATISGFNRSAAQGLDPDFGRGQTAYNVCLGDPGFKPNPALGPIDRAPFYAVKIYPADVGTAGGLVTNEHAQVLDETSTPIPGLYATGNITAALQGRTYLGAGGSIASTMVFGYVAALHAASR